MPKPLYLREIRDYVKKRGIKLGGEGLPHSTRKIGANTVDIVGLTHNTLMRTSNFQKAYERTKAGSNLLLFEGGIHRLLCEKPIGPNDDPCAWSPHRNNDVQDLHKGGKCFNLEVNRKEIEVHGETPYRTALGEAIDRLWGIVWPMGLLRPGNIIGTAGNLDPVKNARLMSKDTERYLNKTIAEMEAGDEGFRTNQYAVVVARSADMAHTIARVAADPHVKGKRITAVVGDGHEPIIHYFLENPEKREEVLREWAGADAVAKLRIIPPEK